MAAIIGHPSPFKDSPFAPDPSPLSSDPSSSSSRTHPISRQLPTFHPHPPHHYPHSHPPDTDSAAVSSHAAAIVDGRDLIILSFESSSSDSLNSTYQNQIKRCSIQRFPVSKSIPDYTQMSQIKALSSIYPDACGLEHRNVASEASVGIGPGQTLDEMDKFSFSCTAESVYDLVEKQANTQRVLDGKQANTPNTLENKQVDTADDLDGEREGLGPLPSDDGVDGPLHPRKPSPPRRKRGDLPDRITRYLRPPKTSALETPGLSSPLTQATLLPSSSSLSLSSLMPRLMLSSPPPPPSLSSSTSFPPSSSTSFPSSFSSSSSHHLLKPPVSLQNVLRTLACGLATPLQEKGLATPMQPPKALQSRTHNWKHGKSGLGWAVLVLALQLFSFVGPTQAQVVGEHMRCHLEGQAVPVPREVYKDNPCLECLCEDGIVVCNKRKCPSLEGCYWKLAMNGNSCCQECKGCDYDGKMYKHGAKWSDGCNRYECQSGVLTISETQCHLPCYNDLPLQDGQCCKKCRGCWFEGRRVPEGETVSSWTDPCIQCSCSSGNLSCEKRACPVLSCPASRQVPIPGSCCKTCVGSRNLLSPPNGRCFLNSHLYTSGDDRTVDPCTVCTCNQGYITCQRHTCPVLNCSKEFQIHLENECCPSCSSAAVFEVVCRVPGMIKKNGEEWKEDKCTSCRCTDGETTCWAESCEYFNNPCPPGYKRVESENECCPRCEEAPGVCTVFGDPHYLTFDGMLFNFQGACRYTLAKSCKGKSFSLKVNNDARRSALFSWTKSLLLNIPKAKVKLGQKLRTKVNNKRVKAPYYEPGVLNITKEGHAIKVSTNAGIRILWDGASYVEVEVPLEMRGGVCGLCGNFNGNVTDDLSTLNGIMMDTPHQMAMSWSTGRSKKCSRKMKEREERRRLQRQNCKGMQEGLTRCGHLNSTLFQQCHAVYPIDQFFKSCVLDMCECKSSRRCECDTIQAYARQCERFGISVSGWKELTGCGGTVCPHGAQYMECAPPCRPSCHNPTPNPDCYRQQCRAGCFCPPPSVLHRGTCIPMSECPRRSRKRHRNS